MQNTKPQRPNNHSKILNTQPKISSRQSDTPKHQIITHKNLQRIWGEIHLAQFGAVNHCGCGAEIAVRICFPRVMILKENVWTSKTFVKD